MTIMRVLLVLLCAAGCGQGARTAVDGVYTLCREAAGYSGETLELKDGRFRYWFYSDVEEKDTPDYPLSGAYTVSGDVVVLDHSRIRSSRRTRAVVNGHPVLWRDDGLKLWSENRKIHPFAVLLRTDDAANRPSIDLLKDEENRMRERQAYATRFDGRPEPMRTLLRAYTQEGDAIDAYVKAVTAARASPAPDLVAQLVAALGEPDVPADSVLQDLYLPTFFMKTAPPFMADPEARTKALEALVDALAGASTRTALEQTLLIFCRIANVPRMDLDIPDAGVRIVLEPLPNDGARYDSRGSFDRLAKIIAACQAWMRERVR